MKISSLVFTFLAITTLIFLIPPKTHAGTTMSPLVQAAARAVCQNMFPATINGCQFYLHTRITESNNSASATRSRCESVCGTTFKGTMAVKNKTKCFEGCKFIFDMDR